MSARALRQEQAPKERSKQVSNVSSSEVRASKGVPVDEHLTEDEDKRLEEASLRSLPTLRTKRFGNETLTLEGNVSVSFYAEADSNVLCVKYVPVHECVAAGLGNGKIVIYNLSLGKYERTLRESDEQKHIIPVTCIKNRRKNQGDRAAIVATYVDGTIRCWEYAKAVCLYTLKEDRQTLGLAFHHHSPKYITVGDDSRAILYNDEHGVQERIYQASHIPDRMDGHSGRVFGVYFNPAASHEFVTGGWDDTVQFWDTRQPNSTRHIYGVHICGDGVSISPNGKELLTCAWQSKTPLQVWDYGSGRLIQSIQTDSHGSYLYCGRFVTNDIIVTGGSNLNVFRIVDVHNKTTLSAIQGFKSGIYSLDQSTSGVRRSKIIKLLDQAAQGSTTSLSDSSIRSYRSYKESAKLPKMTFCSGKKVYECEFKSQI